jgi:hypothetical protein
MSRRLPPPPVLPVVLEELLELDELELLVEYFVDVEDDPESVLTSVPNSVHSSQTSSSAPSILTRFGLAVSVPHISHWTISLPS